MALDPAAAAEPLTPTAPRPVRRTLLTQGWRDVVFLHWAVEPGVVAPLLPRGTRPDVFDGASYVGLIPLRMRRVGLLGGPGLPWLGSFLEVNVRLYSVDRAGRRGVVFRSMDADRLLPVLAARWAAGLPYRFAGMRFRREGRVLRYDARRRRPGPRDAGTRVVVRVGAPLTGPAPLDRFLTARWEAHQVGLRGRTVRWPVQHGEWPLHAAEPVEVDDRLIAAAGLPGVAGPPDSVLCSPGVDVRFGPPEAVR